MSFRLMYNDEVRVPRPQFSAEICGLDWIKERQLCKEVRWSLFRAFSSQRWMDKGWRNYLLLQFLKYSLHHSIRVPEGILSTCPAGCFEEVSLLYFDPVLTKKPSQHSTLECHGVLSNQSVILNGSCTGNCQFFTQKSILTTQYAAFLWAGKSRILRLLQTITFYFTFSS